VGEAEEGSGEKEGGVSRRCSGRKAAMKKCRISAAREKRWGRGEAEAGGYQGSKIGACR